MTRFVAALFMFTMSSIACGDDAQPADVEKSFDEITVMGVRELAALRVELVRAEDAVYELFNDLNDNDDYDIICKMEAPIGSQLKRRNCKARMYRDAMAEITKDAEDAAVIVGRVVDQEKQNRILREKMAAVANQNPELMAALRKRLELQRRLELESSRRFDNASH